MVTLRAFPERVADFIVSRRRANRKGALALLAAAPLAALTMHYATVHSGDTLSAIAARACGHANDWTGIYAGNKKTIGGNPNLILPGQKLAFKCEDPPQLLKLGSTGTQHSSGGKVWGVTYGYPNKCGDGDGDGWDVPCQARHAAPAAHPAASGSSYSGARYSGSPGMQACIISRESGGNSQVMNSTGHYGLYQFSASTWAAHGGNPADFGHASVAEQNQVYYNTVAQDGYSDWAPYDGC